MRQKLSLSAAIAILSAAPAAAQEPSGSQDERLSQSIHNALGADGPWLLPAEQALIARKCGYRGDEAGRDDMSITNGVLICSNGRRVDDPEVRAMATTASERISRRVSGVMASAEVQRAIAARTMAAVEAAMADLREASPRRDRR